MKKLFYLAGLPRTGSTVLTSILYQNPKIHAEGSSALCQTMWDTKNSLEQAQDIVSTKRQSTVERIVKELPNLYYKDVERDVVIDKCFLWTLNGNIDMIKTYVNPNPKFIVMERPVEEIADSFLKLMEKNDSNGVNYEEYVKNATGSLEERRRKAVLNEKGSLAEQIRASETIKNLEDQSMFHYVTYKDLCENTEETLNGIYDFLELPRFEHDFKNVINHKPQDDTVWGFKDMHVVRPLVKREI